MPNVFLVHGSFGKPFENWFPWMEDALSKNNISCIVPHLPTPDRQNFKNWSKLLDCYCDIGVINQDTIFASHSLGPVFVASYIVTRKFSVKAFISISGFNKFIAGLDSFDNVNKPFFVDNELLEKLHKFTAIRHCYMSDNDPYLPIEKLMEFSKLIGGEPIIVKGAGHFNTSSGYTKFDLLLDDILKIADSK